MTDGSTRGNPQPEISSVLLNSRRSLTPLLTVSTSHEKGDSRGGQSDRGVIGKAVEGITAVFNVRIPALPRNSCAEKIFTERDHGSLLVNSTLLFSFLGRRVGGGIGESLAREHGRCTGHYIIDSSRCGGFNKTTIL